MPMLILADSEPKPFLHPLALLIVDKVAGALRYPAFLMVASHLRPWLC